MSLIHEDPGLRPVAIAIHKDGRLFCTAESSQGGELICMNPDGSGVKRIEPRYQGKPTFFNDLTFDSKGNLYVTDSTGNSNNPSGGVYCYPADLAHVIPVAWNLIAPNGIAFGPPGSGIRPVFVHDVGTEGGPMAKAGTPIEVLWLTESGRGNLIHIEFAMTPEGPVYSEVAGFSNTYHFSGVYPCDGMKVDCAGNVYVAVAGWGMILIFNRNGVPIVKALVPGQNEGLGLIPTNLSFKPETDEVYFVASGGPDGANIWTFKGLAKGQVLFSHQ
jgi:lactonase